MVVRGASRGAAYFLTGVARFTSIGASSGRFRAPGFDWEGEFLVLAIGNGRQAGGGHVLCPDAKANDGLLDVGILPAVPNAQVPQVIGTLMKEGLAAVQRAVVTAGVPRIEVEADDEVSVNLDGELQAGRKLRFEARSGCTSRRSAR